MLTMVCAVMAHPEGWGCHLARWPSGKDDDTNVQSNGTSGALRKRMPPAVFRPFSVLDSDRGCKWPKMTPQFCSPSLLWTTAR